MGWFRAQPDGAFSVFVKAKPRASRSRVVGISADGSALEVALTAPPVDGEANDALCLFLSKTLGVRQSQVKIARGGQSRHKQIIIDGVTEEQLLCLEKP